MQAKQIRFILSITIGLAVILLLVLLFKVYGVIQDTKASTKFEHTKVAIITSDCLGDQSWGSLAYKGKLKIEERFPVSVVLFDEVDEQNERMITETIVQAAEWGAEIVIGHGREFSTPFSNVALWYEDVHFVTIQGEATVANQTAYTFNQGEADYFAALAAALKTKSNKIAILDSFYIKERKNEFELALQYYLPEAILYHESVNSRVDSEKAIELMDRLLDKGVDVVYTRGNAYNSDIIHMAKTKGFYVIGYLEDQSYLAPNHVLTSVLHNIPQVYESIMEDYYSEEGIPAGDIILSHEEFVTELSPFGTMFTQKEIDFILHEMERYERGDLVF